VRITNEHRTVGAMLSNMVCRFQERYHNGASLHEHTISVCFQGHAGQSFAAFLTKGIAFELEGDANDGCCKGLSGGRVVAYPPRSAGLVPHENILVGNAALYGATGGQAFFSGVASERFCIRNSGAVAVVEGVGDHGCEYMTRGLVLILGKTGKNFAAGMSGGIAFVLDLNTQNVNMQTVFVEPVTGEDLRTIRTLIEEHIGLTDSHIGKELLDEKPGVLARRFFRIFPKEYKKVLKEAIVEHIKVGSKVAAKILDEFDRMRNPLPNKRTELFSSSYLAPLKSKDGYSHQGVPRKVVIGIGLPIGGPLREVGGVGVVKKPSMNMDTARALGLGTVTENRLMLANVNDSFLADEPHDPTSSFRMGYSLWRMQQDPSAPAPRKVKLSTLDREMLLNGPKWRKVESKLRGESTPTTASSADSVEDSTNEAENTEGGETPASAVVGEILPHSGSAPDIAAVGGAASSDISPEMKAKSLKKKRKDSAASSSTASADGTSAIVPLIVAPPKKQYLQIISDVEDVMASAHLRETAVTLPTKRKGFHLYQRKTPGYRHPKDRLLDSEEIYAGGKTTASTRALNLVRTQASRCMNCGTPTCQFPNQGGGGCPLANRIPVWNSLVHEDDWKRALERLLDTNNFPEFTGTTCPAPCEEACVLGINEGPVTIKSIENAIIDKGFQMGWVTPKQPVYRTKKKVAIVGSGPCGLAAAQQLNRAGHQVTVLEREDQFGGLLFYGIPNMKLEKRKVVRRIELMRQEGITFIANVNVGTTVNFDLPTICSNYDAILFSTGAAAARKLDRSLKGHDLGNIAQAMDFLTDDQRYNYTLSGISTVSSSGVVINQNRYSLTPHGSNTDLGMSLSMAARTDSENNLADRGKIERAFDCADKDVVVIGGGDTAVDVIGTAIRQGAKSVTQFSRRPPASEQRPAHTPWPSWADVTRTDYAHEEYIAATGSDPRAYCVKTREFIAEKSGKNVCKVRVLQEIMNSDGKRTGQEVEKDYPADYVFLAIGFMGAEKIANPTLSLRPNSLFEQTLSASGPNQTIGGGVLSGILSPSTPSSAADAKNNASGITSDGKPASANRPVFDQVEQDGYFLGANVFFAGDCRRGASLVVTAIAEGRDVANRIDEYLLAKDMVRGNAEENLFNRGLSALPRCIPLAQNPALYTRADVLESNEQSYRKKRKMKKPQISEGFERGFVQADDGVTTPPAGTTAVVVEKEKNYYVLVERTGWCRGKTTTDASEHRRRSAVADTAGVAARRGS